jgi:opacity protein-like surface antigen
MKSASLLALLPCAAMAGNFSIAAVAGYGLPVPGAYIGQNYTIDSRSTPSVRSYEAVYGSYADGLRIGGEIGYALNDNVTLGVGVRYEASSEYEFTNASTSTTSTRTETETKSASGIAFIPSVVYTLAGEVYRPYMRVNGHFGMPTEIVKGEEASTVAGVPSETSYEIERTGGIAWGFGGGLGVEYVVSPAMSILLEVVSESWTWEATEQKYTKYTIDGEDMLEDADERQIKTEYLDSYTNDGTNDPDSPSQSLRALQANSAISMNIGLKYRF